MYKYSFLNNEHPEEAMDPNPKKRKTNKPILVDRAVLNQMRLGYDQIMQINSLPERTSHQTTSKIPLSALKKINPRDPQESRHSSNIPLSNTLNICPIVTNIVRKPDLKPITSDLPQVTKIPKFILVKKVDPQRNEIMIHQSDKAAKTASLSQSATGHTGSNSDENNPHQSTSKIPPTTLMRFSGQETKRRLDSVATKSTMQRLLISDKSKTEKKNLISGVPEQSIYNQSLNIIDSQNCDLLDNDSVGKSPVSHISNIDKSKISKSNISSASTSSEAEREAMSGSVNLSALLDKMVIIDAKLDALNSNDATLKRLMGTMNEGLSDLKKCTLSHFGERKSTSRFVFPVENDEALSALELTSRDTAGENAIRRQFMKQSSKDLYEFLRSNTANLFRNTSRFSWSGKVAKNCKHEETARKASDLNVVRILLDAAMESFQVSRDTCIVQFKKALQNYNAAVHMHLLRESSNAVNEPSNKIDIV